jgi:DNA-binding XRE family transcriptional regulator
MANQAEAQPQFQEQPFHTGDRMRKARERTGMDIQTFAEKVGINRGTLAKYETTGAAKRTALIAVSMATGARLEWLQTGELPWLRDDADRRVNDLKPNDHGTITDIFTRQSL